MRYTFSILIILCSMLVTCTNTNNTQNDSIHKTVDKEEFGKVLLSQEDCQLLDVRTAEEFSEGNIEGSQNIDVTKPNFVEKIKNLVPCKLSFAYF